MAEAAAEEYGVAEWESRTGDSSATEERRTEMRR